MFIEGLVGLYLVLLVQKGENPGAAKVLQKYRHPVVDHVDLEVSKHIDWLLLLTAQEEINTSWDDESTTWKMKGLYILTGKKLEAWWIQQINQKNLLF